MANRSKTPDFSNPWSVEPRELKNVVSPDESKEITPKMIRNFFGRPDGDEFDEEKSLWKESIHNGYIDPTTGNITPKGKLYVEKKVKHGKKIPTEIITAPNRLPAERFGKSLPGRPSYGLRSRGEIKPSSDDIPTLGSEKVTKEIDMASSIQAIIDRYGFLGTYIFKKKNKDNYEVILTDIDPKKNPIVISSRSFQKLQNELRSYFEQQNVLEK